MHGIIFTALKKYIRTKLNDQAWDLLRIQSGLHGRIYLPVQSYPDDEIAALLATAPSLLNVPSAVFLDDFGRVLVPDLLQVYRGLMKPHWRTLDLILHVEHTIHHVLLLSDPDPTDPAGLNLHCARIAPFQVAIRYDSPHKLCTLGKGIIHGLAAHFAERITIVERTCLHRGDACCDLAVTVLAATQAPRVHAGAW
jgi:Haem-NO-binding